DGLSKNGKTAQPPQTRHAFLVHIANCCRLFCAGLCGEGAPADVQAGWETIQQTLSRFESLHTTAHVLKERLEDTINRMKPSDVMCMHIAAQNAGLVLRRREADLSMEFFQASPSNAAVTGAVGKLIIQFPALPRLPLPVDATFVNSFSALLAELDCTPMEDAIPKSKKAGSAHDELRDVADIRYISEVVGGLARGLATCVDDASALAASTVYVTKRIDDHVLWDSALLPWRRSPKWLIIRVVLQTTLKQWEMPDKYGYKAFLTFVLAKTLELARLTDVRHDLLFVMSAKISTRLWKLRSVFDVDLPIRQSLPFPISFIEGEMSSVSRLLDKHWKDVQDREAVLSSWEAPTQAQILAAQSFTLPRSSAYLQAVIQRADTFNTEQTDFDCTALEVHFRSQITTQKEAALLPRGKTSPDLWLKLLDEETRIANWTGTASFEQLSTLAGLIEEYQTLATSFRSQNPEIFSRLFLLILDLWVMFDKSALQQFPLLRDYSPELSVRSFEPLLLPELSQMRRLHNIELYIKKRRAQATYPTLSVFTFNVHEHSLPSRYFLGDMGLQTLQIEIERQAADHRNQKRQELREASDRHAVMLRERDQHSCQYFTDRFGRYKHDWWHCRRCILQKQADGMSITVFEWPLPENDVLKRLVLFELRLPAVFSIWRDTTYYLAKNHSKSPQTSASNTPEVILQNYSQLAPSFASNIPKQRITIASTTNSFLRSHYEKHSFPCSETDVILNHPLRYELWETAARQWLGSEFPSIEIRSWCTPRFPISPYTALSWTADSTIHTPNEVIARQSECPPELSYHEWEALGHLRAGVRLQWRNMMLQIITGVVNLADPAVHLLFRQAAWQAELSTNAGELAHFREAHFDLSQEDFGREIVDVLHKRLESISENWKEGWTAATLATLACRLISLSTSEAVKTRALAFLSGLRKILFGWMKEVLAKLPLATKPPDRANLVDRVLQLAASCRSTFDVGTTLARSIFDNRNAVYMFIRCGVSLCNYSPPQTSNLNPALRYSLERDTIISAEAFSPLAEAISQNSKGLDDAVLDVWEGFRRGIEPWQVVEGRWMKCSTSASVGEKVQSVHLNLLDGSLLVDGKAQGTLPQEIRHHKLYLALFPERGILDIMPSKMKGMDYQSSKKMDDFELHFKLSGTELIVRICSKTNAVSEFIAPEHLEGDIPTNLLVNKVHIFHEQSQCVDIYPRSSGWQPDALPAWRLHLWSPKGHPTLSEVTNDSMAGDNVLDPASPLVDGLCQVLRSLEFRKTDLLVYSRSGRLRVSLPHYDLEFSIGSDGLLESKELPGFYIPTRQSIGTLVGLKSKLVLKSRHGEMPKVFIPEGRVIVDYHGDHPEVTISPFVVDNHIKVLSYDIDDIMGRLIGDESLTSWYRLAYLHIITSSYLEDPLIHRTGIQQAQEMLGSACSFAFMQLEEAQNAILQQILGLSPTRKYYPEHLRSMERIEWRNFLVPPIQCGRFVSLVNAVLDYARKQALFHRQTICTARYQGESSLWERAEYRVARLVSVAQISQRDVFAMPPRCLGCPGSIEGQRVVAETVALVRQWPVSVNPTDNLWQHFENWRQFSSEPVPDTKIDNPQIWLQSSLSEAWFSLFHLCQTLTKERNQYGLATALGILSYREMNFELIQLLLLIAINVPTKLTPELCAAVQSIPMGTFHLGNGRTLNLGEVGNIVEGNSLDDIDPSSLGLMQNHGESYDDWSTRRQNTFRSQKESQCQSVAARIFNQWPALSTSISNLTPAPDMDLILPSSLSSYYPIVEIEVLRTEMQTVFKARLHNRRMFESVRDLQHVLDTVRTRDQLHAAATIIACYQGLSPAIIEPRPRYAPVTLASLLQCRDFNGPSDLVSSRQLISRLEVAPIDELQARYITDLARCVKAFEGRRQNSRESRGYRYNSELENLPKTLGPETLLQYLLLKTGQWPSTGPEPIVRQLSRESWQVLPETWRMTLSQYAQHLATKQQQRRTIVLSKAGFEEERAREVAARGGQGWDPTAHPDWLLVQLDADILIRPVQASIAQQMMWPDTGKNALMQLNMGEGKSSVIVPIVSAALADGEQLVRVVVLKPLSAQMFQLLKQRVCGLSNRRLFYLPFSRDVQLDGTKIREIIALFKECARVGGILLCQPEHILSFQLIGLHAFCQSEVSEETQLLVDCQKWLDDTARDVLDESDEILSVRYQLIYTLGVASPIEGRPWRWNLSQAVFTLLGKLVKPIPGDLDISTLKEARRFPSIRILTPDGGRNLLQLIVNEIVFEDGLQQVISFRTCTHDEKTSVSRFLIQVDVAPEDARWLQKCTDERYSQLLLLRGLFAHGILNLSLQEKRWRVDYGLDPRRSMLAVPYRAKDSPAIRAEFGHPDMIIVLTCLSYYYGGLTDQQLDTALQLLLTSDNPEAQYEHWVEGIDELPATLSHLRGLNLDDFEQKNSHIFPRLRYNKAVIDFYLSECVFPKEAREFPYKLSTNAWDLAKSKERLTTGFSGTNDNRYLLPLSIEQLDQESQRHTNTQVLEYILQPENRSVLCTDHDDAEGLLKRVVQQQPPVMVLLDVGAQVLELQNEEVARKWLELDRRLNVEAAVYFDSSCDEIRVILRDGRIQSLASSLYKTQLQKTLVYLDEAHTRGTDFRFPAGTRGVVTLGPKLTKDKLVQGCMRMRRLGTDHSVQFFASAEIRRKIQTAINSETQNLDSGHVLLWTMRETLAQIRDNVSLWANQGLNFDARSSALHDPECSHESVVAVLQEQESRTLEELYGVKSSSGSERKTRDSELEREIREKCCEFGINPTLSALSEEQERELAHEKEDERELERIPGAKPLKHRDDDLRQFITTGLISQPDNLIPLESCLANTSWVSLLPRGTIFRSRDIIATIDFQQTVSVPSGSMDCYLRPVQWILSTSKSKTLVVISPFEANKWLPEIRHSRFVSLRLYSPRVSRNAFWSFDSLDSFAVPRQHGWTPDRALIHELNLFVGQLFCADKPSVKEICGILGLHLQPVNNQGNMAAKMDTEGFVKDEEARAALGVNGCTFDSSPLPFFRELFASRRKGQGFVLTHMGQILRGNDPKDPDFEVDAV
ncbi:hypothetical protein B0H15DRAFT_839505, partial [Mycena belliarum]